jgi:3-phenylpropionate/trans-cinnamate dioxygenase ferredoxin reductase component
MSEHFPYLIIGGGMAADAAVRGIRQADPDRAIGMIGKEPDPPYNRPPLSKGLWKTAPRPMPLSRIWRNTASLGVDMRLGREVVQLDPANKTVRDSQGDEYTYEKLLLANGGEPIKLNLDDERVVYFRTLKDYLRLRDLVEVCKTFAVIGGGFIGSELAAVLAAQGKDVVMIFPEDGIGARVLPTSISTYLNTTFRERGVRVLNGHLVKTIEPRAGGVTLHTNQGSSLSVEGVVAGLGIRPSTGLARSAGLETGNGILVDPYLRTSHPDIFSAGDVSNFYNPLLDIRMRVEHEEHANLSGQTAGLGMAGQPAAYEHLPSVYSTLFDLSYDAVGDLNPTLQIVYDWQEPFRKGAAYYMQGQRVRGVLLWNLPRGLDTARQLIANPGPISHSDLVGAISG